MIKAEADVDRRGFHLEKSISVGHILTTVGLVVACITWTSSVDKHLAIHDTEITTLQESDRRQTKEAEASRAEILAQLQRINDKIDRYLETRPQR